MFLKNLQRGLLNQAVDDLTQGGPRLQRPDAIATKGNDRNHSSQQRARLSHRSGQPPFVVLRLICAIRIDPSENSPALAFRVSPRK